MADSNIVELQSRRNTCADELTSVIKEHGKSIDAAILLYASSDGKLNISIIGEVSDLEVLGWLQYASRRFMEAE